MSTTLLSAAQAASARFSDDPDTMPSDESFLARFRSQLNLRPSEQLTGYMRGGTSIADAQEAEKAEYLRRAKAQWQQRHDNEKRAAAQATQRKAEQAEFAAGAASGRFRRELIGFLDRYRTLRTSEGELAARLETERTEEKRLCREVTDLLKLAKAIGTQRDLLTAIQIRLGQLRAEQLELVTPLRQSYSLAKREFAFAHAELVKRFAHKKIQIDKAAGYLGVAYGGHYNWPFEQHDRREEDLSAEEVMSASFKLEARFAALDPFQ